MLGGFWMLEVIDEHTRLWRREMRVRLTATVLMCGLSSAPVALAQPSPPPDPNKVQVLVLTGQNVHDWRGTTPVLKQVLEATGRFEVRVIEEVRGVGPETLAPYQLLLVNYYNRGAQDRWGERAQSAVEEFVKAGKGLVIYHLSLGAFDGWTEYEKMSGGNWRPNNGHHSARHDFTVDIKDTEHPITKGLKALPVKADELYANLRWQPEGSFHVLATAYDDHALYNGRARQPTPGAGIHQPILWTTAYGQGRVFVTTLGHGPDEARGQAFGVTLARGAEWAATGKVTLPIPAELAK
jgi:type 1 glutamine amidotransferase